MKSHTKLKAGFRLVVDSPTTTAGRAFDIAIQVAILISIIGFTLETLPSLSSKQRHWLSIIEATTVGVFTLSILRIWVADSKKKYLFSFYGIVDFFGDSAILSCSRCRFENPASSAAFSYFQPS